MNDPIRQQVTVYQGVTDTEGVPQTIAQIVDQIGQMSRPEWAQVEKTRLPAITFAGLFHQRGNQHLQTHSGMIVIDWDNHPRPHDLKARLRTENTLLAFISPSRTGVKGIFTVDPIPSDNREHGRAFDQLVNQLPDPEYIDMSGRDMSRLCFAAWDPLIWVGTGYPHHWTRPPPAIHITTHHQNGRIDQFNDQRSEQDFHQLLAHRGRGNVSCPLGGHSGKGKELSIHRPNDRWIATAHCDKHKGQTFNYLQLVAALNHAGNIAHAIQAAGLNNEESRMSEIVIK